MNMKNRPEAFDAYEFLSRIQGDSPKGEQIMLSDEFRATDLGLMLKTALRAIELLAEQIHEQKPGS